MKLTAKNYWVVLCDSSYKKKDYLICGVYADKKEAQEVKEFIADCPAKHIIKKCKVTVEI